MNEHKPKIKEMSGENPSFLREGSNPSKYIIPVTVFLVVAVFVSLILFMGLMDLRRLDKTLVEFMENRGLDIVTTIENVAQEDLDFLRRTLLDDQYDFGFAPIPLSDKEYHIQERLINALVDVARDIDAHWQQDELTEEDLERIAAEEKLSLIVILDEEGHVVLQSRQFQEESSRAPLISGSDQDQLARWLLKTLGPLMDMGYIALRRKDGSGTIVIALDAGKLKYWGTKTAVKKVVGEIGWEQELHYLSAFDRDGTLLGTVGDSTQHNITTAKGAVQEILSGKRSLVSTKLEDESGHHLSIIAPLHLDDTVVGYVHMGLKWDRARATLSHNRTRMIITTLVVVLIGTISTIMLYRNQSRELARMEKMKERLQRAEQLSALGQLAAGVAHEIRNPLNAISIAAQRLQREFAPRNDDNNDFSHLYNVMRDEIRRLNEIIEEFVTFFRIKRMELRPRPLENVLEKIMAVMATECGERNIVLEGLWNDKHPTIVSMDADKLTQAFINIVKNAMEAIDGSKPGRITLAVERRGDRQAVVTITDTGSGLTPDEVDRIFNPEYTTKEKGLGLGLTLAHEIINGHGGEIRVTSRKGFGTTFEILLPLAGYKENEKTESSHYEGS